MNAEEIISLVTVGSLDVVEGVDPANTQLLEIGIISVDGLCPVRVQKTSTLLDRSEDIGLNDESNTSMAVLCFTEGSEVENPAQLTGWRYAAFLIDCDHQEATNGHPFKFRHDYVVVDEDRLAEYLLQYKDGAPVWGGFSHEEFSLSSWRRPSSDIIGKAGISVPTSYHLEAFHRHLNANNSFDQFLRLYHSIELLFDYVTVKKVQSLGNDLSGFADIMKAHGKAEIDRLYALISEFCPDHDAIGQALNQAANHEQTCQEIFQDYSKDRNPLDSEKYEIFWSLVAGTSVNATSVQASRLAIKTEARAHELLCKIAAYWIYRIRCSIAHNRVGEFILNDEHDEFVGSFGLSLLQAVVQQILSNPEFIALNIVTAASVD